MIGKVVGGKYRVYDKVGGGGMAEVFLARDLLNGEIVALKVLRNQYTEGGDYIERFKREAMSAMKLAHPNICAVKDFGDEEGVYFMVLEFVEGKTLSHIIEEKGPLPVEEAVSIIKQAAAALEEAYKNGIIAHRDVKSQNIMVTPSGQVKMMDFGIAKSRDFATMTTAGSFVGTPEYMSPEQAQGLKVDSRSDMYSLGVVLYEALAGEVPFEADTPWGVLNMHISKEPFPISNLRSDIPSGMTEVLKRLLSKNPDDRFQKPSELIAALDIVMKNFKAPKLGKVKSKKIPRSNAKLKKTLRNVLVAALLVVAIGGGATAFYFLTQPKDSTATVQSEPAGATIFIRGPQDADFRKVGTTNQDVYPLAPGNYRLKLELKGFAIHESEFNSELGKDIKLDTIKLSTIGKLEVQTKAVDFGTASGIPAPKSVVIKNAGGSDVTVGRQKDGDWIEFESVSFTIPSGQERSVMVAVNAGKVSPGNTYRGFVIIKPEAEGAAEIKIPVSFVFQSGKTSDLPKTENPDTPAKPVDNTNQEPPKPTLGTLAITSNVPGAQILIDGAFTGTTPKSIQKPPGKYVIKVKKGGYNDFNQTVTVVAGETMTIDAILRNK